MTPSLFPRILLSISFFMLLIQYEETFATPSRAPLLITGKITVTRGVSWTIPGDLILQGRVTSSGKTMLVSDTVQHLLNYYTVTSNLGHIYQKNNHEVVIQDSCRAHTWHHEGSGLINLNRLEGHLIMTDTFPVFYGMNDHAYLVSDSGHGTCTLAPEVMSCVTPYFFPMGNTRMGYTPLWIDDTSYTSQKKLLSPVRVCLRRDSTTSLTPSLNHITCSMNTSRSLLFTCKQPFAWCIQTDTNFHYRAKSYLPASCGALPHRILSFPWGYTPLNDPCNLTEWTYQDSTRGGTYQGSQSLSPASGISSLLPIASLELATQSGNDAIHLSWKILGMHDYTQYSIMRSRDGIHFTMIGTLYDTPTLPSVYDDRDIDPGIEYYYQVQGILPYDTVVISNIAAGRSLVSLESLSLSPQPCDGYTRIHSHDRVTEVILYDAVGNRIAYFSDDQGISLLDTRETPSGYYLAHITTTSQEVTLPLIILHHP